MSHARVVVVGLGPAGADLVTPATSAAIARTAKRYLRTVRHPAAAIAGDATSFDAIYDTSSSLEEVYARIVDALVEAASMHSEVLYAVPGSPAVGERTVELLLEDPRVDVDVVPAMSFLDLVWARLGVDPVAAGVRVVDGHRFSIEAAGERGPLLVAQCDSRAVLSEVKLAVDCDTDGDTAQVTVLQRLGLPDEAVFEVAWPDLDRAVAADHLTTLWIPRLAAPVGRELVAAVELGRTLREQCPWDREQTHASLIPFLLEEAYEFVEAVQHLDQHDGDPTAEVWAHLEEELGDLLYQVIFHSTLAAEQGAFTIADVARGLYDKLVRRHPHVFGDATAHDASEVLRNWEEIKREEKSRTGVFEGVAESLPALLYASALQRRAATVGFDWREVADVYPKVEEELQELRDDPSEDEVGDLLFAVVNVARHLDVDPEVALRRAALKFRTRFEGVERLAGERNVALRDLDLARLDAMWEEVKATSGRA